MSARKTQGRQVELMPPTEPLLSMPLTPKLAKATHNSTCRTQAHCKVPRAGVRILQPPEQGSLTFFNSWLGHHRTSVFLICAMGLMMTSTAQDHSQEDLSRRIHGMNFKAGTSCRLGHCSHTSLFIYQHEWEEGCWLYEGLYEISRLKKENNHPSTTQTGLVTECIYSLHSFNSIPTAAEGG